MKKMSETILFFGNERLATGVSTATPTLNALIATGYKVGAVVVAQNELGKSRQVRDLEVATTAEQHGIPLITPDTLSGTSEQLAGFGAIAAVLVAYGQIVPQDVLKLFPQGIINVHPSLLPLQRGSTPVESVILSGAPQTGVSLMQLTPKMDAGPIYAQNVVPLQGNETKQNLADRLSTIGSQLVMQHLPHILDGSAIPLSQNNEAATFSQRISKQDGAIDWGKPAVQLEREVRAYSGWPRSRTTLGTTDIIITRAHASDGQGEPGSILLDNKLLGVCTSNGVLIIDSLIPAGKKEMPISAFLAGYKL